MTNDTAAIVRNSYHSPLIVQELGAFLCYKNGVKRDARWSAQLSWATPEYLFGKRLRKGHWPATSQRSCN